MKKLKNLFHINDTPEKIALGFGLGVFAGIMPGTGPIASLFLAFIFRANRASALIGSLITNTWLSFATFILAVKTGSWLMEISWQDVRASWDIFIKNFSWQALFKLSVLKTILPVMLGYIVVAFCLGVAAYLAALIVLRIARGKKNA
jgi:uncharacterized protein (DUF2062 family)